MNDAHLHMVVNHFPIIGTFFFFLFLITGMFLNNDSVKNHEHEELAEKFILVLYATGVFALISLGAAVKKFRMAKIFSFITLVLALISGVLSIKVGTSGGEIRHTEIREESAISAPLNENPAATKEYKEDDE